MKVKMGLLLTCRGEVSAKLALGRRCDGEISSSFKVPLYPKDVYSYPKRRTKRNAAALRHAKPNDTLCLCELQSCVLALRSTTIVSAHCHYNRHIRSWRNNRKWQ